MIAENQRCDLGDDNRASRPEKKSNDMAAAGKGDPAIISSENNSDQRRKEEDPSTQKKPRVLWTVEMHRKFAAAVNQLGIKKAIPKKIHVLMNVEGLPRASVASHLQKYRLHLARTAQQQAKVIDALGSLRM